MTPIRVVLAGDGAVARQLRDAGIEVVYLAPDAPAEHVARVAIQEDADAVVTLGDGNTIATELTARDAADIPVVTPLTSQNTVDLVRTTVRS